MHHVATQALRQEIYAVRHSTLIAHDSQFTGTQSENLS